MYKKYEKLLKKHNVTTYRVSKDTGIPQTTLSSWKTRDNNPGLATLVKLSTYFGVPLDYWAK